MINQRRVAVEVAVGAEGGAALLLADTRATSLYFDVHRVPRGQIVFGVVNKHFELQAGSQVSNASEMSHVEFVHQVEPFDIQRVELEKYDIFSLQLILGRLEQVWTLCLDASREKFLD